MKKLGFLLLMTAGLAFGQTKKVVGSDIQWWGYKVMKSDASSHYGKVNLKSGNIVLKNNQVAGGTFVLDMTSINATDVAGEEQQKLNGHLKNGDFFEVEKFPIASFTITSVKANNDKVYNYVVNGNLTVKGKTEAISFPAKINNSKGQVSIVSNKFSFDRQKFGVNYKAGMKDVVIKDDIDMLVKVTAR
ncbi:TPA: YceI family protein [Elizabethkingia anophelis]|uniref:YceI family protein n=1 Tax=Elizabethkingia anophelis TaxID=1117645 RepID=UPI0016266F93|nr:YceI family protein [Elizabethkingia anophelis]MCT3800817.1 YceI family protein [Elizabethkingia anophelis]MCT4058094.1 YceI family protein [Elizabethkingia anophelis]MCT4068703.1 YceI family protein [Elizabethkingia anophelis]MCT4321760.1 YceI family protein [Elizabethkingia anophelis]HAY3533580.1 YceI family protein [Elizabethkingia anophelis]